MEKHIFNKVNLPNRYEVNNLDETKKWKAEEKSK